jgi:hypothetical protein
MTKAFRYLLVLGGVLGATALAMPALAYDVGPGSSGSAPGSAPPGQPFPFTVNFKQPNGSAFPAGVPVTFSLGSGPAGCTVTFNPPSTVTDASGSATTSVTLPAGCCPGTFVIVATAEGGGTVTSTVSETGCAGFPNTSASLPSHPGIPFWTIAVGAGLLLVLVVGSGTAFMRIRRSA